MQDEFDSSLAGRVSIFKKYLDGSKEKVFEDDNLIVRSGKYIAVRQLSYTGKGDPITYAKVGIGGAIDPEGQFLKTPTISMTDLYNPIGIASVTKIDEDAGIPSVTLLGTLDDSAGNGYTLNEAGFFSESGIMFNIKTFPGIPKNSTFSLEFLWVIRMR